MGEGQRQEAERVWEQIRDLRDEAPYRQAAVEIITAAFAEKDRKIARLRRERYCAEARVGRLEEALDDLLDGLNANADERCGLTTEQWDKRVKNARAALEDLEDKKPDGIPF